MLDGVYSAWLRLSRAGRSRSHRQVLLFEGPEWMFLKHEQADDHLTAWRLHSRHRPMAPTVCSETTAWREEALLLLSARVRKRNIMLHNHWRGNIDTADCGEISAALKCFCCCCFFI